MSIQKKSLISTLKTAKKANVASAPLTHVEGGTAEKQTGKALALKRGVLATRGLQLGHTKKAFAKAAGGKRFGRMQARVLGKKV